jgi:hypothetical protein
VRRPDESVDDETQRFYTRLLAILNEGAFTGGSFALVETRSSGPGDTSHDQMVAFFRRAKTVGSEERGWLVIANLGLTRAYARIPVPIPLDAAGSYIFDDRLNEASHVRAGRELVEAGLFIDLAPGAAHVFRITA